jgi:hypothetical protein
MRLQKYGILILTPMVPMVPELAREIERLRIDAGLTVDELLGTLREQREQYYVEHYAREDKDNESRADTQNVIENDAVTPTH